MYRSIVAASGFAEVRSEAVMADGNNTKLGFTFHPSWRRGVLAIQLFRGIENSIRQHGAQTGPATTY